MCSPLRCLCGIIVFLSAAGVASAQRADTLALDLASAVQRAVRLADEAQLAALGIDVAAERAAIARASILPQVTMNSSYSQVVRNARAEIVGNVFGQSFNYAANLLVSQNLFQGGREYYAWRAAAHDVNAARLDASEVHARLQVDVQRAYLGALLAARIAGIQRNGVALAGERLRQVEQLEASGRAARYDVLRARVELANLQPVALQADNDRALAELELRRLINVPLDQPLRLTTDVDARAVQAVVASVVADAGDTPARAGVRAAELAYRARRDAVGAARGGFLPTVSVFLRTGYLALPGVPGVPTGVGRTAPALCPPGSPDTRACQNNGWFRDESFGVQLSWPLFDGFRAKSDLDLATAQAEIAAVLWREREEAVAAEVARARAELARAQALFEARQFGAGEATEAFQLASLRFSRGLGTQLEVSDAQFALMTAQSNEARAVYELHLAAAELARALGRPVPLPPAVTGQRASSQ